MASALPLMLHSYIMYVWQKHTDCKIISGKLAMSPSLNAYNILHNSKSDTVVVNLASFSFKGNKYFQSIATLQSVKSVCFSSKV